MKNFYNIVEDIQVNTRKINKKFNEEVALTFESYLYEEADKWYKNNIATTDFYKRTYQLSQNSVYLKKVSAFEYKIELNPRKMKKKKWQKPNKDIKGDARYTGIMGSYMDIDGKVVASDVLEWEEEGTGPFARYNYSKGSGIYASALKRLIADVDKIEVDLRTLLSLSLGTIDIARGLLKILKQETKELLQKEYNELYK